MTRPIAATTTLAAPPQAVYALLADLREHWRLTGRWVEALELGTDGGVVRLRGPFGIARTARTRVVRTEASSLLAGEALLGTTRAEVSWTLVPEGAGTTCVTLRADILAATRADRLLLAAGGRRWLRRRFRATLSRLAAQVDETSTAALGVAVG